MHSYTRNAIIGSSAKYCYLADKEDYIEATKWANGEGVDIQIGRRCGDEKISITYGEFELMKQLIGGLE